MCGIAGIVAPGRESDLLNASLGKMVESMTHRGPDSAGSYVRPGVALGMRRLSIIDLAGGDQPISNEDGSVWVIQNGEIYNYRDLRKQLEAAGHGFRTNSDTEVLVHGWEQWGEKLLDRLNGMFAFAIWEEKTRRIFMARDRMGIKPLYWASDGDLFCFSSELKGIMSSGLVDIALDQVAWGQYLVFEYVPAPRSILRNVHKLEAASCVSVTPGHPPLVRKYWDLRFEPDRSGSPEQRMEEVRDALERSAKLELVSDVPVGILLSGGVDSTAVTLAATRNLTTPPLTFTVGFEDPSFDESDFARDVASHLGATHHETRLGHADLLELLDGVAGILDEPLADSSLLPTYLLSRFVRESVKVALGGDGGDELWAGYPTMYAHKVARVYRRLPRWLRSKVIPRVVDTLPVSFDNLSFDFRAKRFVSGSQLVPELQHQVWMGGYTPSQVRRLVVPEVARELSDEVLFEPILRRMPAMAEMEPDDRILFLDASLYMEGDILTKVDRASMACSLEVRVPLLNREVVEVARKIPFEWKLRGSKGKSILRSAIQPWVPPHVSSRGKKGFNVPIAKWLRGPHAEMLKRLGSSHSSLIRDDQVATLIGEHMTGRNDHRKLLWPLLVFEMWQNEWMLVDA